MKYPWDSRSIGLFRELWNKGECYEDIGEALGLTAKSIGPAAKRFGFTFPQPKKQPKPETKIVQPVCAYESGFAWPTKAQLMARR